MKNGVGYALRLWRWAADAGISGRYPESPKKVFQGGQGELGATLQATLPFTSVQEAF